MSQPQFWKIEKNRNGPSFAIYHIRRVFCLTITKNRRIMPRKLRRAPKMSPRRRTTADFVALLSLLDGKTQRHHLSRRDLRRAWRLLPQRDRSLLTLLRQRGASLREVAGLLGVSRITVRRMAGRAVRRATDPENLAILASWQRLKPEEQRLVYLHRFLGMSLRRIARLGPVATPPSGSGSVAASRAKSPRAMWRKIRRKVRRWARTKQPQEGPALPSSSPASSPPSPEAGSSAG